MPRDVVFLHELLLQPAYLLPGEGGAVAADVVKVVVGRSSSSSSRGISRVAAAAADVAAVASVLRRISPF